MFDQRNLVLSNGKCILKEVFDKYGESYPELICQISKDFNIPLAKKKENYRTFFSYVPMEDYEGNIILKAILAFEYKEYIRNKLKYEGKYELKISPKYEIEKSDFIVKNLDEILLNLKIDISKSFTKEIYDNIKKLTEKAVSFVKNPEKMYKERFQFSLLNIDFYLQKIQTRIGSTLVGLENNPTVYNIAYKLVNTPTLSNISTIKLSFTPTFYKATP
ncbi:MAG: hypothetical protein QW483_01865 [Nanopusillaceae archaeon]